MQAMMLAAGFGRRMGKHTQDQTKCMMEVGDKKIVDRIIDSLRLAGIYKFIIVLGYQGKSLKEYLQTTYTDIEFVFIENIDYAHTNNIYSLHLASEELKKDDTILLESDLVFDKNVIKDMVEQPESDLVAVAKYEHWMDGTVTRIDAECNIVEFIEKKDFQFDVADGYYKTVNIYKFSKEFVSQQYLPFLSTYILAYGKNQYYESVLRIIAHVKRTKLKAFLLDDVRWYEIDDPQDLAVANALFGKEGQEFEAYDHRYGGFWRFPKLIDFCYLVNPYFPTNKMNDQIKYFFDTLIRTYPSGLNIQNALAAKIFGVDEDTIIVGNGAAELINYLGQEAKGTVALCTPVFHEYIRCFKHCKVHALLTHENNFKMDKQKIMEAIPKTDYLVIVNPDNPTGSFLHQQDLLEIVEACQKQGVVCIVDESFVDFAEEEIKYTLIDDEIIQRYSNLIVIKSISKSYGVPGLRLGVLLTSNQAVLNSIKEELSIWNINSFAEYFMQIMDLYQTEYVHSCTQISRLRKMFATQLETIDYIETFPSQANYIMCRLSEGVIAKELANYLVKEKSILIKDLSGKEGITGNQYIRLAVREEADNQKLIDALRSYKNVNEEKNDK